ncbi:MAG TPA: transketolase C-terminal domain-containing protein [Bacteroidia bacterium]|jgi:transketolase|nr:transketolase C-terminal domain-containing protein [Bacteroidia bacterium]
MIQYNSTNIRVWSLLGQSRAFGNALLEIAKENKKIMAVTSDLAKVAGLDRFGKAFPDRLINTGIAEQNMVGIAAALATEELIPFAISFASFSTMRACEPSRHFLGYMQRNVKLIGISSGFATGIFGNTHYCKEDFAIMRAISGIVILSPADCTELVKAIEAAVNYNGPVYIRLTGQMNNPIVYKDDYAFEIGKAIKLKSGDDITIVATGSMVCNSLKAAELLEQKGIKVSVIDMHTIKPLDTAIIDNEIRSSKLIVSVEEHSKIGGLGGAIAEHLSELKQHPVLLRLGIEDEFQNAGNYLYMLEQNHLLPEQIAANILEKYLLLN